ncbi:hypothetical protein [Pararhizobium arenae]|uniref:hypothetical protein n=1 Tax=Pararhizobium arenae TaxID=1856850 RepID=UPI00094B3A30|nr:hypothetical protein [Pararhizobium arenae]
MTILQRQISRRPDDLAKRDEIIHALYLRLKAEWETRQAIAEAAQNGASAEVIEAMATDPVPPIDEFGQEETVRALLAHPKNAWADTLAQSDHDRG